MRNTSCYQDTFPAFLLVVAAALTVLMTRALLTILVTGALLTILMTGALLTVLMSSALLTILMTGAALTVLVVATAMTAFAGIMVAASVSGTAAATSRTLLSTAASGQFGAGSRISLHVVGIVTQLAHLLTQLVGIGSLRIIVDSQLRRLHVVSVRLNALEIRHILFEFVGAFLTNAIGLNRHLTSSLRHPKVFVKEFFDGFVTFHDHCSGEKLSVERQSDLYSRHGFGHAKHLVYA